jgi:FMN phosphatase YigB (HAD superfamily)
MTLTILFDLDDTLLSNNMDNFLPHYLKALSQELAPLPADKVIQYLMAGTQKMLDKHTPAETLEQVFDRTFYSGLGVEKQDLLGTIQHFYADVFPTLKYLTRQRPESIRLVEYAFERGFKVAIATKPLFPIMANLKRLEWAGLPADKYPYALVPSFEKFHFSKPELSFFAELLAQLGWPDQPALMIGDNLEDDIIPASQFGLPAFWITNLDMPLPEIVHPLSRKGAIEDIIPWLEQIASAPFEFNLDNPTISMAILKSTPAAFDSLSLGLSRDGWKLRPAVGEWSLTEIICHLRDVELEQYLPRLKRALTENNPLLPIITTDRWAIERNYQEQSGPEASEAFLHARIDLLQLISDLAPEAWQRKARHVSHGIMSFSSLVGLIARHDIAHLQQSASLLNHPQPIV